MANDWDVIGQEPAAPMPRKAQAAIAADDPWAVEEVEPAYSPTGDYSNVFRDDDADNDGIGRIALRALVGRAPNLIANAIELPANTNEALTRALGMEPAESGTPFSAMRNALRSGAAAVRDISYEPEMEAAGYGEPSRTGAQLVEALNPYANENRRKAAAEFGEPGTAVPLTPMDRIETVARFIPETLVASAPDMAATINPATLYSYIMSRTNEIAGDRAQSDNREQINLGDIAAGGAAAPIEALLERFTTMRLLPNGTTMATPGIMAAIGRIARELGLQGSLGGIEELAPYLAQSVGTETGFSGQEALENFAGGAVAEGAMGAGGQTVKEVVSPVRQPSLAGAMSGEWTPIAQEQITNGGESREQSTPDGNAAFDAQQQDAGAVPAGEAVAGDAGGLGSSQGNATAAGSADSLRPAGPEPSGRVVADAPAGPGPAPSGGRIAGVPAGGGAAPVDGAAADGEAGARAVQGELPPQSRRTVVTADEIVDFPGLSDEQRAVESRARDQVVSDPEKALRDYAEVPGTDGGRIVSTDEAREVFGEYNSGPDARSKNAVSVHEPASWIANETFRRRMAQPVEQGKEPVVFFTGGGTGAGKSTGPKRIAELGAAFNDADTVFDGNLQSAPSAIKKIDLALKNGRSAHILYTFRDPTQAFLYGALPRAERQDYGRTVPTVAHAGTHVGAAKTFFALREHYAGNPNVKIEAVWNDFEPGVSSSISAASDAEIRALAETSADSLKQELDNALEDFNQQGRVSPRVYHGTRGEPVPEQRRSEPVRAQAEAADAGRGERARRQDQGRQQEVEAARAAATKIAKDVDVVDSMADIPADVRSRVGLTEADDDVEGFFDEETGKAYVIYDNLRPERAQSRQARAAWVAAHETAGHRGIRALLGDKLAAVLRRASNNDTVKAIVASMSDPNSRGYRPETGDILIEEALVELAAAVRTGDYSEIRNRYGVEFTPDQRSNVRALIERMLAAIRDALGGEGFSDAQLYQLIEDAGRANERAQSDSATRGRRGGSGRTIASRVGTRNPSAVKATESGVDPDTQVGYDSFKADNKSFEKNVGLISKYTGIRKVRGKATADRVAEAFVTHARDNILALYDAAPKVVRERARKWYEGANKVANEIAKRYGVTDVQAAAAIAALSPQKDWYQNLSLAERIIDATTNQSDRQWDGEMSSTLNRIFGADQYAALRDAVDGKALSDLSDPVERAAWIRTYDQTHNDPSFPITSPEGEIIGTYTTATGNPASIQWGSLVEAAKAVSVLEDGGLENVSALLGNAHKIRSFYNNIIDPASEDGDVTIDTHAVAAALIRPLSAASTEVSHAFGAGTSNSSITGNKGTYGLYAEAYRRAAADRGIKAREIQSIVWEAVRTLFPGPSRRPKSAVKAKVESIWDRYAKREINHDQATEEAINAGGGVREPDWARPAAAVDEGEWRGAFRPKVSGAGVPGRGAKPIASRRGNSRGVERGVHPDAAVTLNVGLSTAELRGGGELTANEVIDTIESTGARVLSSSRHISDSEPTLVIDLDRPLTEAEGDRVSEELDQQAIVQRAVDGSGELFGPMRDEWGPYNPAYFVMPDGERAGPVASRRTRKGFSAKPRQPDAVSVDAYHYSTEDGLTELDPSFAGTAGAGRERRRFGTGRFGRQGGTAARLGFYVREPGQPVPAAEDAVSGAGGRSLYRVQLDNLYDLDADPRGFVEDAGQNQDMLEEEIADAGFDGFLAPPQAGIDVPTAVVFDIDGTIPVEPARPIASRRTKQTDTPEFRRWFGDSKVVDENGEPLVVYHGTSADFDVFDVDADSRSGHPSSGLGAFFTASPSVASQFARDWEGASMFDRANERPLAEGANTMPVYLSLQNPAILTDREFRDLFVDRVSYKSLSHGAFRSLRVSYEAAGHDGIIVEPSGEVIASPGLEEYVARQYVVFHPEQIKSATGNRGAFDPADPSIIASRRPVNRSFTTGVDSATTRGERFAAGRDPIVDEAAKTNKSTIDDARKALAEDPDAGAATIIKLTSAGVDGITLADEAILLVHKADLMNRRIDAERKLSDGRTSEATKEAARQTWMEIEGEIAMLDAAALNAGREWGRFGQFRQRQLREDYSLAALEQKERARLERPLTPAESATIKAMAEKIADQQKRVDELQERIKNAESEWAFDVMTKALPRRRSSKDRIAGLRKAADEARARLKATPGVPSSRRQSGAVLSPAVLADYAVIGAYHIANGAATLADWVADMTEELGDAFTRFKADHPRIFKAAADHLAAMPADRFSRSPEEVLAGIDTDNVKPQDVRNLVAAYVGDGVRTEPEVIGRVASDIGATPEETRALFVQSTPRAERSLTEAEQELRDLRKIIRIEAEIDRLEAGREKAPPRQRKADSEQVAEKKRELLELRRRLRPVFDAEGRYQAMRGRAIQKRIDEIRTRIANEDFAPRVRVPRRLSKANEQAQFELAKAKEEFLRHQFEDNMRKRSPLAKIFGAVGDTFNLARAILTSFDLSGLLRQGGFISFGHPVAGGRAFAKSLRAFLSDENEHAIRAELESRPNAHLYKKFGLQLTGIGAGPLTQIEEAYASRWLSKLPTWTGAGLVRGSGRAYVSMLNRLRADSFDAMAAALARKGELTDAEGKAIAGYVNAATGRGKLGSGKISAGEDAAQFLNTVFFAPRLVASRFQLLIGQPLYGGTARTRRLIAQDYARFAIGVGVTMSLLTLAADDDDDKPVFEVDPRSSNFLKVRFGNTYVDAMTGLSQVSVFLARLASGESKAQDGSIKPLRSGLTLTDLRIALGAEVEPHEVGDDGSLPFGSRNAAEVIGSFMRTKLAPVPGAIVTALSGENVIGEVMSPAEVATEMVIPMSLQDIAGMMRDNGVTEGTALALMGILGMGVQHRDISNERALADFNNKIKADQDELKARLMELPLSEWQAAFDDAKDDYGLSMQGVELAIYKSDGKYGKKGEPQRTSEGRPRFKSNRLSDRDKYSSEWTREGYQVHHIIPDNLVRHHPLMDRARELGYDLDNSSNLIEMSGRKGGGEDGSVGHRTSHPKYDAEVFAALQDAEERLRREHGSIDNAPRKEVLDAVHKIEDEMRERIENRDVPVKDGRLASIQRGGSTRA